MVGRGGEGEGGGGRGRGEFRGGEERTCERDVQKEGVVESLLCL